MKPAYILFILSLSLHAIVITTIPKIRVASDSQEYLALADSLSQEGAYRYNGYAETFRTPGYPSFLFFVRACLGGQNNLAVAFLQAVLAGVTAVCIFYLTQKLFTNSAAWLAAILYIFNPGAWNSTTSILTETLFVFLLTLSLTMLLFNDPIKKGLSSIFFGLSCLARPALLWLFVPIGFILGFYQKAKKERVVFLLVFVAGIALTQGSWLARNYGHYGEWYFTEIKSYYLYAYVATQVKAMRSGRDADVLAQNAIEEYASARKKYPPPELNRIYTQKAWEIIDGDVHSLVPIALKGMTRQVIDTSLMKFLERYNPDLPLTASAIKTGILSPPNMKSLALALLMGGLRAFEIILLFALFAAAFLSMAFGARKRGWIVDGEALFWVITLTCLYLFLATAGPCANSRLREQYMPFLLILASPVFVLMGRKARGLLNGLPFHRGDRQ